MKAFKSKRKKSKNIFGWILIVIISFYINMKLLKIYNPLDDNFKLKIKKEEFLLNLGLNYYKPIEVVENVLPTFSEVINEEKRTIFLYTSHEKEDYVDGTVKDAQKLLSDELEKLGYEVIIDKTNISKVVDEQKLTYKDTYKVTRDVIEKYLDDDISLFIDLHRDSVKNTTYNEYAKLMFVIGAKHDTYENNYEIANSINMNIENIDTNISRGIYTRKSSSYNQDLASNIILIELGSNYNKMSEINNTVKVLAKAIDIYLGE